MIRLVRFPTRNQMNMMMMMGERGADQQVMSGICVSQEMLCYNSSERRGGIRV
jgi:hypothetical protein